MFLEKSVLQLCSKFPGEHICRSAILIATLLKSDFGTVVPLKICWIFSESLFPKHLWRAPFGFWLYVTYTFLFMRNVLVLHCLLRLFICCKTKLKKNFFSKKYLCFFTKYTLFAEKKKFYKEKSFIMKNFFTEKSFFYREKYKQKCKKIYISFQKYVFTVCVTNKI